jgi:hypothetical protein
MFFVLVGIALEVATPRKDCAKSSIFRHETVIDGSMHRVCIKCGAEFDADYFEARNGGGNVMRYYRMTKPPKLAANNSTN